MRNKLFIPVLRGELPRGARRLLVTLGAVLVFLLFAFSLQWESRITVAQRGSDTRTINAQLYFPLRNPAQFNAAALQPEKRRLAVAEEADSEQVMRAVLEELIRGPASDKHGSVISSNARVEWIKKTSDWVGVSFSSEFLEETVIDSVLARYCVVMTLSQFDDVRQISLYVDGVLLTDEQAKAGILMAEDLVDRVTDKPVKYSIRVYFPDYSRQTLIPESREVEASASLSLESFIVKELLKGPASGGKLRISSDKAELLSVKTEYGTCTLNFNAAFYQITPDPVTENSIIYSIVNSLTEMGDIRRVRFLQEGKEATLLGGTDVSGAFVRAEDMIQTEDSAG